MVSSADLYMQWTHFGWQAYFQSQHSTISVIWHWKGTWHRYRCASIWMYLCPRRGMHTVPLVRLFTPLVFCPLCGCTIGEKRGPVSVSQKTPAGWLSWRLLTSAWWYAFTRDLTGKGVHLVGNPRKERGKAWISREGSSRRYRLEDTYWIIKYLYVTLVYQWCQ